jgi:hypothetical protein
MHLSMPLATFGETLVSALAGLLGVIVGALLTWWRERQQQQGKTLSAARLINVELDDMLAKIENAIQPQSARPTKALAVELETPVWAEARGALALGLDREEWNRIRDAFASVLAFRVALEHGGGTEEIDRRGREAMHQIQEAQTALAGR